MPRTQPDLDLPDRSPEVVDVEVPTPPFWGTRSTAPPQGSAPGTTCPGRDGVPKGWYAPVTTRSAAGVRGLSVS